MESILPPTPRRRRRRGLRVPQARRKRAYEAIEKAAIAKRCEPASWPWLQDRPAEIAHAEANAEAIRASLIAEARRLAAIAWKTGGPPP